MKQKEYIGLGTIENIADVLKELSANKIFLVTGKDSYKKSGAEGYLKKFLADYKIRRFCDFSSDPKLEDVEKGIELSKKFNASTVMAVGGGSVIDTAKLVNFFGSNKVSPAEFLETKQGDIKNQKPMIAIPTTAGSGSEATHFAVVYVGKRKHSIADKRMLAQVAIVDANLTISLPKYTTAVSGLDALSQAVESYWSIHSTSESKQFASDAIKSTVTNLAAAVNNPTTDARLKMAEAAHLAGKAINITKTTAAHSISYPLTSYFGIPHGQAVGVTLSPLLTFNASVTDEDVLDKRGARYARATIVEICKFLGASSVNDAREKIDDLIREISLQTWLSMLGLRKKEDIEIIIANGFYSDRMANNPRRITEQSLREILEGIY